MKKLVALLALVCLMVIGVTSCAAVKFDINFMVDGESYGKIITTGKEILSLPDDPKKEGYTFDGWYWDEGIWEKPFTANSLLDAPLTSNLSVYAHFVEEGALGGTVDLKFNTMGGSVVPMQTVVRGARPTEPDIPSFEGYYFCGWYTYPDYQTPFSFDEPLTAGKTVYAKWSQVGSTSLAINDFEDMVKVEQDTAFHDIILDKETNRTYVIYKLGTMKNVILGRVTSQSYYNQGGGALNWGTTDGWEESLSRSVEYSVSCALTVSAEVTLGVFKGGLNFSIGMGESHTYENTRSIMAQFSQGGTQSLDGFEKYRYYDMFVVGNQTVYQYFVFDADGKYEGTALTAAEISSGLMPLSSQTPLFVYEDIPTLTPLTTIDYSDIFPSGTGVSGDPYLVNTPQQLVAVGLRPDASYKLGSDIDLASFKGWKPIGACEELPFSGSFDGNGKTIRNLKMNYAGVALSFDRAYGIFGFVSGHVEGLKLSKVSLEVSENHEGDGRLYTGALCGELSGTLNNVQVTDCQVVVKRDKSHNGVIIGHATGTINNVTVARSSLFTHGDGGLVVGALVDGIAQNSTVSDCELSYYAARENRSNGGVVGYAEISVVKDCTVKDTEFILAGSSSAMHKSGVFGLSPHHYCPLAPCMGYVVGCSDGSAVYADSHVVSGNSAECKTDGEFVTKPGAGENKYWFKCYGGKVGTER